MTKENRQNDVLKKENRKALKVFIPIIIGAALIGGLFGFFSQMGSSQDVFMNMGFYLREGTYAAVPYLVMLTEVLTFAAGYLYYKKAKSSFADYDLLMEKAVTEEDEEKLDEVYQTTDQTLSISLVIVEIGMVFSFLFFGVFMSFLLRYLEEGSFILPAVVILFFLAGMFTNLKLQQLAVDLVKQMNPKMRGSVYDLNFNKKWTDSCDEAEMMTVYKASYRAFKSGNIACTVLWVLTCLGDMLFHFGPVPVICVSLIWLIMQGSYCIESVRLEKGGSNVPN